MPDPLDVLRQPAAPVQPRPAFANELRSRIERALGRPDPGGATMPETTTRAQLPAGFRSLQPYIAVRDAAAAIAWYRDVFAAVETGNRYTEPSGRIGHAELTIGDSVLLLSDEYPDHGATSPQTLGGTAVSLQLYVDDVDEVVARARRAGGTVEREPADQPYGDRSSVVRDPFGHRWMVQTHLGTPSAHEIEQAMGDFAVQAPSRQGELFYLTMRVGDGPRAARFFTELLGWRARPGHEPQGFHVESTTQPLGLHGGHDEPGVDLYFVVDDLGAAMQKVRELGGQVEEPATYDSGGTVLCHDDQGTPFYLSVPAPGY